MDLQALIIQHPQPAAQLILLFHGGHTTARAMLPCAQPLAQAFPQALVACIEAPYAVHGSEARAWIPTELAADRAPDALARHVQDALPAFLQVVLHWQTLTGVGPEATALVGFGQGATLVLESTQTDSPPASRVVAMAGQFATLPHTDRYRGTIHFLHGKSDAVVPYQHTIAAAHRVRDLGGDLTAEVIPFIGHELHADFIDACVEKLSTHVSRHLWEYALAHPQEPPVRH